MLGRERRAVHLIHQQHVIAVRVGKREAPLIGLLDASLNPVVAAGKDDLAGRAGRRRSTFPTASTSQGWLTGRGSSRALPLPAHSIVTRRVVRGIARMVSRSTVNGDSTT